MNVLKLHLCLLLLCICPLAAQTYKSAHAIVVSQYGNQKYILLGEMEKNYALSTFGGFRDSDETDPRDTCARELEEETLGILGNRKAIRKLIENGVQVCGFQNGHICYLLPSNYYGKNIPYNFRQIRFSPNQQFSFCQREMIDIVAIPVAELKSKFAKGGTMTFPDNDGIQRPLRNATRKALEEALDRGLL